MWLIIATVLMTAMNNFSSPSEPQTLDYSGFIQQVKNGKVERVAANSYVITGKRSSGNTFRTVRPVTQDSGLVGDLVDNNVIVKNKQLEQQSTWARLLVASSLIPVIIAAFTFLIRQMQGGSGGRDDPMSFDRSKVRLLSEDQVKITLTGTAGCDEARKEVSESVELLRNPDKSRRLGGRVPHGVSVVGPPGTGKTSLAKVIVGEARMPFFTTSGSDFVEMFVGVGASRVRDTFDQAKKYAPCTIFIDEIDVVGCHRGAGPGGGHDEHEQTLNQLLVEVDGSGTSDDIIVIAAINRPDVLDLALLRSDRFSRQVVIDLPGIRGREQILKVYMRKVSLGDYVDPAVIARGMPGFSGTSLANLVNEASLLATRSSKRIVDTREFELAKDKIIMGIEYKTVVVSEKEKRDTVYHEVGHAIVGRLVPEHSPVYKVSITLCERAPGVTMSLPEEDRYSLSKHTLGSQICSLFGGRIVEEMTSGFEGTITSASNDAMHVTQLAQDMVTKQGLSERLGPLMYAGEEDEVLLGHSAGSQHVNVSDETAKMIDQEVQRTIDDCYGIVKRLLDESHDKLEMMADALIEYEIIDFGQIDDIMAGHVPRELRGWQGDSGINIPLVNLKESGYRENTPLIGGPVDEY